VEELLNEKIPIETIFSVPEKMQLLTQIKPPSRGWFYAYLRWFQSRPNDEGETFKKRYGREAWENEFMVFDTFLKNASRPLQMVFADHCLLDVFITDEEDRDKTDRLWLTLLIDAFSRSILGFALLHEGPCIESIQGALKNAIWLKDDLLARAEIDDQPWNCYGIPEKLSLDNAWAHHSHSLETLSHAIGKGGRCNSIQLEFRPPYRGRYGALIERLFGNFSTQIKALLREAIRGQSPQQIRSAKQRACLLYEDLEKIIIQLIVGYQHTVHSELDGMTPHQKWLDGISQTGVPPVLPQTTAMQRLFLRRSPETRTISTRGVSVFGMDYWSSNLAGTERTDKDGKRIRYSFGYDPGDISVIALFRNGSWIGDATSKQLRQADGTTRHVSLAERKLAKEIAKANGLKPDSWIDLVKKNEALEDQRQKEKEDFQKKKRSRSKNPKPALPTAQQIAQLEYAENSIQNAPQAKAKEDDDLGKLYQQYKGIDCCQPV
jgi:putative transposase